LDVLGPSFSVEVFRATLKWAVDELTLSVDDEADFYRGLSLPVCFALSAIKADVVSGTHNFLCIKCLTHLSRAPYC
jgi:hypothetical protein